MKPEYVKAIINDGIELVPDVSLPVHTDAAIKNTPTDLKETGSGPGNRSGLNGIANKLRTANKRLGRIERDLDDDEPNEIAERIDTVRNLLDTVPKQAQSLAGTQLPEGYAGWVGRDAEAIRTTLEGAIDAE